MNILKTKYFLLNNIFIVFLLASIIIIISLLVIIRKRIRKYQEIGSRHHDVVILPFERAPTLNLTRNDK